MTISVIDFDLPSQICSFDILESDQLSNRLRGKHKYEEGKFLTYLEKMTKRFKEGKPPRYTAQSFCGYGARAALGGNGHTEYDSPIHLLSKDLLYYDHLVGPQLLDFYFANMHLIPDRWVDKTVYYWGTIFRAPSGRCILMSHWDGEELKAGVTCLGNDYGSVPGAVVLV